MVKVDYCIQHSPWKIGEDIISTVWQTTPKEQPHRGMWVTGVHLWSFRRLQPIEQSLTKYYIKYICVKPSKAPETRNKWSCGYEFCMIYKASKNRNLSGQLHSKKKKERDLRYLNVQKEKCNGTYNNGKTFVMCLQTEGAWWIHLFYKKIGWNNEPNDTVKASQEFLKADKWNILQWPSQSIDLNPMDQLFTYWRQNRRHQIK